MINNNCYHEYSFKFLQKNKYDSKISSAASENYYNDIHCNSFLLRNDMIVVLIVLIIILGLNFK